MRRLIMIALLAGVAGVTVLSAELASATAPGANGRIAFARDDPASPGNSFTFAANADGSDLRPLFPGHHSGRRISRRMARRWPSSPTPRRP